MGGVWVWGVGVRILFISHALTPTPEFIIMSFYNSHNSENFSNEKQKNLLLNWLFIHVKKTDAWNRLLIDFDLCEADFFRIFLHGLETTVDRKYSWKLILTVDKFHIANIYLSGAAVPIPVAESIDEHLWQISDEYYYNH